LKKRNLEIAVATTTGLPKDRHSAYTAPWLELEYGLRGWWTTELHLEGVSTRHDGSERLRKDDVGFLTSVILSTMPLRGRRSPLSE
jgi:hypothetical protein